MAGQLHDVTVNLFFGHKHLKKNRLKTFLRCLQGQEGGSARTRLGPRQSPARKHENVFSSGTINSHKPKVNQLKIIPASQVHNFRISFSLLRRQD